MTRDELKHLARLISREIIEGSDMRRELRDLVLQVVVHHETIRNQDAAQAFIYAAAARGVKLVIKDGELTCNEPEKLGSALTATLTVYRPHILEYVRRMAELEGRTAPKLNGDKAGK